MNSWIDIPPFQLLAVIVAGLFVGWAFVSKFLDKPIRFALLAGLVFFGIRFIPAYAQLDTTSPGAILGNGIVSGGIMWVPYIFSMAVGYLAVGHTFPNRNK